MELYRKYYMELLLIKENLWDLLTEEIPTGERALQRWNRRDAKARALIGLSVEVNQLVHIRSKKTAAETWESLRQIHKKDTLVTKIHLIKRICSLRMKDDGNIEEHINELSCLLQRLLDIGDTQLSEQWKVGLLLASLPENYGTLVTALEVRPENYLTWSLVHAKLLDQYQRQKDVEQSHSDEQSHNDEKVLKISKLFCQFCKKDNHRKADCIKLKSYNQFKEFKQMMKKEKE